MNRFLRLPGLKAAALLAGGLLLLTMGAQVAGIALLAMLGLHDMQATPFTLVQYTIHWRHEPQIADALWLAALCGLIAVSSPALLLLAQNRPKELHGKARWASAGDVRRTGLLGDAGIIVGEYRGKYLHHNGTDRVSPHVFLAAPTGSGKSQGVMYPNALSWPGSLVVTDIKGELFRDTSKFRRSCGQDVHVLDFAPQSAVGGQYNPFTYVDDAPEKIAAGVWRIAEYLIPEIQPDNIWSNGARQVFAACALYFYGLDEQPTLPKIRALLNSGFVAWCRQFIKDDHNAHIHHPECLAGFTNVVHNPPNTVGGFITTAQQALNPLNNDLTAAVLSGNSFDLRALRRTKTTIYVIMRPQDKEQFAPIARLFFQQLIDVNTREEFSDLPPDACELLLGLDEFATLGKLPAIANAITVVRSYGIRMLIIVQNPSQLATLYGRDDAKTFTNNFGCGIYFTPGARDIETAEELSKLLGNDTVRGRNESRRKYGVLHANVQLTTSEQRRPLLLPQEIMTLRADTALVLVSGCKPIRATKLLAATDSVFKKRMLGAVTLDKLPIDTAWTRAAPVGVGQIDEELIEPFEKIVVSPESDRPETTALTKAGSNTQTNPTLSAKPASMMHLPTALDLLNLDSATQADFDVDYSHIVVPKKLGKASESKILIDTILSVTDDD